MDEFVAMDVNEIFGNDIAVKPVEEQVGEVPTAPEPAETVESPETNESSEQNPKHFEVSPKMYVYFDMEFTGLVRDADLLSIGLCDAEGHSFYAEFNDFNYTKISPWVFENVLKRMVNPQSILEGDHWSMRGTTDEVRKNLLFWLQEVHEHTGCGIQFVTDCGHYDMVFLIDLLWKEALKMPEWVSPVSVDINNELANLSYEYNIRAGGTEGEAIIFNPWYEAFNLNRDEYASNIKDAPMGLQHNSMYDAYVIRAIHQNIWDINVEPHPLCERPVSNE